MKNNDKLNIVKIKVIKIKYLIILLIVRVIIIMIKKNQIFSLTFNTKPIRSIIVQHNNMVFIKFVCFTKKRKYILLKTYFCFYKIVNGAVIIYIYYIIYKLYVYIK